MKLSSVASKQEPEAAVADLTDDDMTALLTPSESEKDGPALVAGALREDTEGGPYRDDANMLTMAAIVADLDGLSDEAYRAARQRLLESPYEHWFHETHSHGSEARRIEKGLPPGRVHCARVWFPFNAPLDLEGVRWKGPDGTWARLLEHVGFPPVMEGLDTSCMNTSRLYFLPRHPAGESRDFGHVTGARLDPTPFVVRGTDPRPVRATGGAATGEEDPTREVDLAAVRERLERVARGTRPAAPLVRKLLDGEMLAPAQHRHAAWRDVLGVLGAVAEPWESTEALLTLGTASRAAEIADGHDPNKHTWENLEKLLVSGREKAAERRALKAEVQAREMAAFLKLAGGAPASPAAPPDADDDEPPPPPPTPPESSRRVKVDLLDALPAVFTDVDTAVAAVDAAGAVVLDTGDDVGVARILNGPEGERLAVMKLHAWGNKLAGRVVMKGADKPQLLAAAWFKATKRRYRGVQTQAVPELVDPAALNLWRGLAVDPRPGDVTPMLELLTALSGDDPEGREYLLKWCAWAVQHPTERATVAVAIRGPEGIGKNRFADAMQAIFGKGHSRYFNSPDELVGKWTAGLAGACFVVADEVFVLDKAGSERIKGMLTNDTLRLEGKNQPLFNATNAIKLLMLTNSDRVVRVDGEARRWVVLDAPPCKLPFASEEYRQYWRDWSAWLDNGGVEAWAAHLLAMDLGTWHPRHRPQTKGLTRQQHATWGDGDPRGWLRECLEQGTLSEPGIPGGWPTDDAKVSTRELYQAYIRWIRDDRHRQATPVETFGKVLKSVGCVPCKTGRPLHLPGYRLPQTVLRAALGMDPELPDEPE